MLASRPRLPLTTPKLRVTKVSWIESGASPPPIAQPVLPRQTLPPARPLQDRQHPPRHRRRARHRRARHPRARRPRLAATQPQPPRPKLRLWAADTPSTTEERRSPRILSRASCFVVRDWCSVVSSQRVARSRAVHLP